jgi:hypothetical protein
MHGSLLHGFKRFVVAREGEAGWEGLVREAGVSGWYFTNQIYPDEELGALLPHA